MNLKLQLGQVNGFIFTDQRKSHDQFNDITSQLQLSSNIPSASFEFIPCQEDAKKTEGIDHSQVKLGQ